MICRTSAGSLRRPALPIEPVRDAFGHITYIREPVDGPASRFMKDYGTAGSAARSLPLREGIACDLACLGVGLGI